VLTFTYRGAWGSEGTFSIQHAVADTAAALAFLRSEAAARNYGVDRSAIVIAGHSMGGYLAAHAATQDGRSGPIIGIEYGPDGLETVTSSPHTPPLAGVILLDAWNIAATAREVKTGGDEAQAMCIANFDDIGHALGPITAEDICDDLIRRGEEWDLIKLAPALGPMRVLMVFAAYGLAKDNNALADAIPAACPRPYEPLCPNMTISQLFTDHAFVDHRIDLAREVVEWLRREIEGVPGPPNLANRPPIGSIPED
jgi:pimeloyl-ACP methyl ester carboxylesterase